MIIYDTIIVQRFIYYPLLSLEIINEWLDWRHFNVSLYHTSAVLWQPNELFYTNCIKFKKKIMNERLKLHIWNK
jgi:hypothetical protein